MGPFSNLADFDHGHPVIEHAVAQLKPSQKRQLAAKLRSWADELDRTSIAEDTAASSQQTPKETP